MRKMNKIISTVVTICFLFNTAIQDLALAQTVNFKPNVDKLATPSINSTLAPIERTDIVRINAILKLNLLNISKKGVPTFDKAVEFDGKRISFYNPRDMQFFFHEPIDIGNGRAAYKCVVKDNKSFKPRTYYVVFEQQLAAGIMPAAVYTKAQFDEHQQSGVFAKGLPQIHPDDAKIMVRDLLHELGQDTILRYAYEETEKDPSHPIVAEPINWNYRTDLYNFVYRYLDNYYKIRVTNPNNLMLIQDRSIRLVKITPEIENMMRLAPKVRVVIGGANGKEMEVPYYAHPSDHAFHFFVDEKVFNLLTSRDSVSRVVMVQAARDKVFELLRHDIGAVLALELDENLKNEIERRWEEFGRLGPSGVNFKPLECPIVSLSDNPTRDYAMGWLFGKKKGPAAKKPTSVPIQHKPTPAEQADLDAAFAALIGGQQSQTPPKSTEVTPPSQAPAATAIPDDGTIPLAEDLPPSQAPAAKVPDEGVPSATPDLPTMVEGLKTTAANLASGITPTVLATLFKTQAQHWLDMDIAVLKKEALDAKIPEDELKDKDKKGIIDLLVAKDFGISKDTAIRFKNKASGKTHEALYGELNNKGIIVWNKKADNPTQYSFGNLEALELLTVSQPKEDVAKVLSRLQAGIAIRIDKYKYIYIRRDVGGILVNTMSGDKTGIIGYEEIKFIETLGRATPAAPAKVAPAAPKIQGSTTQPGKSPEAAMVLIASAKELQGKNGFTVQQYCEIFTKYASPLGFEPTISESQARRDLNKLADNGFLHKEDGKSPYIFKVSDESGINIESLSVTSKFLERTAKRFSRLLSARQYQIAADDLVRIYASICSYESTPVLYYRALAIKLRLEFRAMNNVLGKRIPKGLLNLLEKEKRLGEEGGERLIAFMKSGPTSCATKSSPWTQLGPCPVATTESPRDISKEFINAQEDILNSRYDSAVECVERALAGLKTGASIKNREAAIWVLNQLKLENKATSGMEKLLESLRNPAAVVAQEQALSPDAATEAERTRLNAELFDLETAGNEAYALNQLERAGEISRQIEDIKRRLANLSAPEQATAHKASSRTRPGKSPEDLFKLISLYTKPGEELSAPKLYKLHDEHYKDLGFEKPVALRTTERDLFEADNSLLARGLIKPIIDTTLPKEPNNPKSQWKRGPDGEFLFKMPVPAQDLTSWIEAEARKRTDDKFFIELVTTAVSKVAVNERDAQIGIDLIFGRVTTIMQGPDHHSQDYMDPDAPKTSVVYKSNAISLAKNPTLLKQLIDEKLTDSVSLAKIGTGKILVNGKEMPILEGLDGEIKIDTVIEKFRIPKRAITKVSLISGGTAIVAYPDQNGGYGRTSVDFRHNSLVFIVNAVPVTGSEMLQEEHKAVLIRTLFTDYCSHLGKAYGIGSSTYHIVMESLDAADFKNVLLRTLSVTTGSAEEVMMGARLIFSRIDITAATQGRPSTDIPKRAVALANNIGELRTITKEFKNPGSDMSYLIYLIKVLRSRKEFEINFYLPENGLGSSNYLVEELIKLLKKPSVTEEIFSQERLLADTTLKEISDEAIITRLLAAKNYEELARKISNMCQCCTGLIVGVHSSDAAQRAECSARYNKWEERIATVYGIVKSSPGGKDFLSSPEFDVIKGEVEHYLQDLRAKASEQATPPNTTIESERVRIQKAIEQLDAQRAEAYSDGQPESAEELGRQIEELQERLADLNKAEALAPKGGTTEPGKSQVQGIGPGTFVFEPEEDTSFRGNPAGVRRDAATPPAGEIRKEIRRRGSSDGRVDELQPDSREVFNKILRAPELVKELLAGATVYESTLGYEGWGITDIELIRAWLGILQKAGLIKRTGGYNSNGPSSDKVSMNTADNRDHLVILTPKGKREFSVRALHIEDKQLATRVYNKLEAANIRTIGDLITWSRPDLLKTKKVRGFGKESADAVETALEKIGLHLAESKRSPAKPGNSSQSRQNACAFDEKGNLVDITSDEDHSAIDEAINKKFPAEISAVINKEFGDKEVRLSNDAENSFVREYLSLKSERPGSVFYPLRVLSLIFDDLANGTCKKIKKNPELPHLPSIKALKTNGAPLLRLKSGAEVWGHASDRGICIADTGNAKQNAVIIFFELMRFMAIDNEVVKRWWENRYRGRKIIANSGNPLALPLPEKEYVSIPSGTGTLNVICSQSQRFDSQRARYANYPTIFLRPGDLLSNLPKYQKIINIPQAPRQYGLAYGPNTPEGSAPELFGTLLRHYLDAEIAPGILPPDADDNDPEKVRGAMNKVGWAREELLLNCDKIKVVLEHNRPVVPAERYSIILYDAIKKQIFEHFRGDVVYPEFAQRAQKGYIVKLKPTSMSMGTIAEKNRLEAILLDRKTTADEKQSALRDLKSMELRGLIPSPHSFPDIFIHCHTTFSYGPTPEFIAWRAYQLGLGIKEDSGAVGIVDHYTNKGIKRWREATRIVGIRNVTAGVELRVRIPGSGFENVPVNFPNVNGEVYIVVHGIDTEEDLELLANARMSCAKRFGRTLDYLNTEILNNISAGFRFNYIEDVASLLEKEANNPMERHLAEGIARKIITRYKDPEARVKFVESFLGECAKKTSIKVELSDDDKKVTRDGDVNKFLVILRNKLIVPLRAIESLRPDSVECPDLDKVVAWAHERGWTVGYPVLGGGAKCCVAERPGNRKKLRAYMKDHGIDEIDFMPDRNTPAERAWIEETAKGFDEGLSAGMDVNTHTGMPYTSMFSTRPEFIKNAAKMVKDETVRLSNKKLAALEASLKAQLEEIEKNNLYTVEIIRQQGHLLVKFIDKKDPSTNFTVMVDKGFKIISLCIANKEIHLVPKDLDKDFKTGVNSMFPHLNRLKDRKLVRNGRQISVSSIPGLIMDGTTENSMHGVAWNSEAWKDVRMGVDKRGGVYIEASFETTDYTGASEAYGHSKLTKRFYINGQRLETTGQVENLMTEDEARRDGGWEVIADLGEHPFQTYTSEKTTLQVPGMTKVFKVDGQKIPTGELVDVTAWPEKDYRNPRPLDATLDSSFIVKADKQGVITAVINDEGKGVRITFQITGMFSAAPGKETVLHCWGGNETNFKGVGAVEAAVAAANGPNRQGQIGGTVPLGKGERRVGSVITTVESISPDNAIGLAERLTDLARKAAWGRSITTHDGRPFTLDTPVEMIGETPDEGQRNQRNVLMAFEELFATVNDRPTLSKAIQLINKAIETASLKQPNERKSEREVLEEYRKRLEEKRAALPMENFYGQLTDAGQIAAVYAETKLCGDTPHIKNTLAGFLLGKVTLQELPAALNLNVIAVDAIVARLGSRLPAESGRTRPGKNPQDAFRVITIAEIDSRWGLYAPRHYFTLKDFLKAYETISSTRDFEALANNPKRTVRRDLKELERWGWITSSLGFVDIGGRKKLVRKYALTSQGRFAVMKEYPKLVEASAIREINFLLKIGKHAEIVLRFTKNYENLASRVKPNNDYTITEGDISKIMCMAISGTVVESSFMASPEYLAMPESMRLYITEHSGYAAVLAPTVVPQDRVAGLQPVAVVKKALAGWPMPDLALLVEMYERPEAYETIRLAAQNSRKQPYVMAGAYAEYEKVQANLSSLLLTAFGNSAVSMDDKGRVNLDIIGGIDTVKTILDEMATQSLATESVAVPATASSTETPEELASVPPAAAAGTTAEVRYQAVVEGLGILEGAPMPTTGADVEFLKAQNDLMIQPTPDLESARNHVIAAMERLGKDMFVAADKMQYRQVAVWVLCQMVEVENLFAPSSEAAKLLNHLRTTQKGASSEATDTVGAQSPTAPATVAEDFVVRTVPFAPPGEPQRSITDKSFRLVTESTAAPAEPLAPAQDVPTIQVVVPTLQNIMKLVPAEWIEGWINLEKFVAVVTESGCEQNIVTADNKSTMIFSEKATFGEYKDGKYEEGLGVILPSLVKSSIKVAVIATTDKQKALIDELNSGISADQKIIYAENIEEIKAQAKTARYYFFKVASEADAGAGVNSITIVVKKILEAIGHVAQINNDRLMLQLHEAARQFAIAA